MTTATPRRNLLIVGGCQRNIPPVFANRFNLEHLVQSESAGYVERFVPDQPPDLVVVLVSWTSHHACSKAREIADAHGVPCIESPGGFSKLRQRLIDDGITWVEEALADEVKERPETPKVGDDPWIDFATQQQEAALAAEAEVARQKKRVEELEVELECVREDTAQVEAVQAAALLDLRATLSAQHSFLLTRRDQVEQHLASIMGEHSALTRQINEIEGRLKTLE